MKIKAMRGALAVLLITLGLGQLASAYWNLAGLSVVGARRVAGYGLGGLLLAAGGSILPDTWSVLGWSLPAGLATLVLLVVGGTLAAPPHPDEQLLAAQPGAQTGCRPVQIPDGAEKIPGILFRATSQTGGKEPAVCIVPGAGDTKISFKWRLIKTLLAEGLTVLTIDPPGHGQYRRRPLSYPDCLSVVPAAVHFLQAHPQVSQVGLIGISLGGALSLRSLAQKIAENDARHPRLAALVVVATPTHLDYSRALFYREVWNTLYGAPTVSLFKEMSAGQAHQTWRQGGYRSRHTTAELFELLDPLASIEQFKNIPTLLVYSSRDAVATADMAEAMQQAAPWAACVQSKKASHVMLTLIPAINQQIGQWLKMQLKPEA